MTDISRRHLIQTAATRINNQPALRISPHVHNTPEELERLATLAAA